MKVGKVPSLWMKEKSEKLQIPFADLVWVYVAEDVLIRVSESSYHTCLCMADCDILACGNRLTFYYVPSGRRIPQDMLVAGQDFSEELLEKMLQELFTSSAMEDIIWISAYSKKENCYVCQMTAVYEEMKVPVSLYILPIKEADIRMTKEEVVLPMHENRQLECFVYTQEDRLGAYVFEIMNKLELISDMEAYAVVNDILKQEPISGRHMMEQLAVLSQKYPKVLREKRLEQLAEYQKYTYMRKRWEQYEKNHKRQKEEWSSVLTRILSFVTPIWTALCRNEIFFDDWMPELERYLG